MITDRRRRWSCRDCGRTFRWPLDAAEHAHGGHDVRRPDGAR